MRLMVGLAIAFILSLNLYYSNQVLSTSSTAYYYLEQFTELPWNEEHLPWATQSFGHKMPDTICSSPESNATWPLQGDVLSINPKHTCGLRPNIHPFTDFLIEWNNRHKRDSCETVIYGVSFGSMYLKEMLVVRGIRKNPQKYENKYGKCFHIFGLQSQLQLEELQRGIKKFPDQNIEWVGVPDSILPYKNHRRNVKLFKFLPQLLFPNAKRVIWQDMKLFTTYLGKQPANYKNVLNREQSKRKTCLMVQGLPVHENTVGLEKSMLFGIPRMMHHCQKIVDSLEGRPKVTDSPQAVREQCKYYIQHLGHGILDQGMIDSAFLVWHFNDQECREFNARLQCEILNQIHCFADRDQLAIPYAMGLLNLTKSPRSHAALDNWNQHGHQLVHSSSPNKNLIHFMPGDCHWYFRQIGACKEPEGLHIAIMVVGTLNRLQLKSMFDHVLKPMKEQGQVVDYFLSLSTAKAPVYRQNGGYAENMIPDPFLGEGILGKSARKKIAVVFRLQGIGAVIKVTSSGTQYFLNDTRIASRMTNDKDFFRKFPAFDTRKSNADTSKIGNTNMLSLFYNMEELWKDVLRVEEHRGRQYDYVLILRDDALWLQDFSLNSTLNFSQPAGSSASPDAFVLSCDARKPPMLSTEICDHAILVKRSKAPIFTRYFSSLLEADLEQCHKKVGKEHNFGSERGCNSEMIMKYIAETKEVSIQKLPQSLLPFERANTLKLENGTIVQCLHKFCQSRDLPLQIPSPMQRCSEIK